MQRPDPLRHIMCMVLFFVSVQVAFGQAEEPATAPTPPEAPTNLVATDKDWDAGGVVDIAWEASTTDASAIKGYQILSQEVHEDGTPIEQAEAALENEGIAPEDAAVEVDDVEVANQSPWDVLGVVPSTQLTYQATGLDADSNFIFAVRAIGANGASSNVSNISEVIEPVAAVFNGRKLPLFIILAIICGAVMTFVVLARGGMPMKIRTIAGLKAVDEAVGRATEMGRSILYINGIQDMDDLQTVAGVTVLGHVAKTAAEYDAKIEVPTSRSLVMTAARETVQSSYFSAGRPDAYNPDLIYYVTDEQFGFVAYVSGMMTREKPAACFYMGAFFAESLILAETGNSVGAIQIAGTANPSQLPFFVAACDYTLIGEEFFAASAYLSGQPDQLGSLKGQDVGKILVGVVILTGVTMATLYAVSGSPAVEGAVTYLTDVILGS